MLSLPALQDVLGEPVMEVELAVGDVLYMPRGTVHQATAQSSDSSHITISTYQRCSYADLATHLLQVTSVAYRIKNIGTSPIGSVLATMTASFAS